MVIMSEIYFKILAAVAPAIVLSVIIIRKDKQPEPTKWLLSATGADILVAAAVLLLGILVLPDIQSNTLIGAMLSAFICATAPEEGLKFIALYLLLRQCIHFDEMFDGIVYAVCIGMEFAGVENTLYLFGAGDEWVALGIARALMSVPMLYFFAVIMGSFFSLGWFDRKNRGRYMCVALILPIIVHGLYDTLCFSIGLNENFGFYILVAFILGFKYIRRYVKSLTNSMLKLDGVES